MGIQARQVVRFAKKNGIKIVRRGYSSAHSNKGEGHCALGVISHMTNGTTVRFGVPEIGLDMDDMMALESGFEGWYHYGDEAKNPYFKVGKNIARLAGVDNT